MCDSMAEFRATATDMGAWEGNRIVEWRRADSFI